MFGVSYLAQISRGQCCLAFFHVRTLSAAHVLTGRKSSQLAFMIAAASAAVFTLSTTAFAQGTAAQANANADNGCGRQ